MDGNFGYTAGVAELLLQSHTGVIHLLPALPMAWPDGRVQGLRARGGFEVDILWKNSRLMECRIRSLVGGICRIQSAEQVTVSCEGKQVPTREIPPAVEFDAERGKEYLIRNI
jgi:alpha-L-fucosidase 2